MPLASIPSPTQSVWHLGPIPVRAYALCIVAGIFVALALAARRWRARGGREDEVWDVAVWAIILGIIGGRLYHVITDHELYFGAGRHPLDAVKIWDGGLGIWGAIALGTFGAWLGVRRRGIRLSSFADASVPGVVFAQGIGRFGNWFNNELYGGPTSVPWRLQIHCMDVVQGHAQACAATGSTTLGYFQPTFLYEAIWDIALGFVLLWADRRWRLGRGNVFALYAMGYTAGRAWIEALRSDYAHHILGLRINDWVAILVFLGGLTYFLRHGGLHGGREPSVYVLGPVDAQVAGASGTAPAEPADERPDESTDTESVPTDDSGSAASGPPADHLSSRPAPEAGP